MLINNKIMTGHDLATKIRMYYELDNLMVYCNYNSHYHFIELRRISESHNHKDWMLNCRTLYLPFFYKDCSLHFTK